MKDDPTFPQDGTQDGTAKLITFRMRLKTRFTTLAAGCVENTLPRTGDGCWARIQRAARGKGVITSPPFLPRDCLMRGDVNYHDGTGSDSMPHPVAFSAPTVIVYSTPLVSPLTVSGLDDPDALNE